MKVVALLLVLLTLILSVNLRVSGVESSNKSVDEFSYNSFFHLLEWKKCDKINLIKQIFLIRQVYKLFTKNFVTFLWVRVF